jgi:hypothetical protein
MRPGRRIEANGLGLDSLIRFVELANEVAMWKVEGRDYVGRRDYDSMEKLFIAAENRGSRSRTPHKCLRTAPRDDRPG